ncbi:MAG: hypothetical protein C5B60_10570 [Chloroflexi bacterium]|nr:MAG: hypothetical protein C5B60_10570 [Chloroflexota bacterium]
MRTIKVPTYVIEIDEDRIRTALKNTSSHCMIADAIRDQVPHSTRVQVDIATIRWSDTERDQRYIFLTPYYAQQAIIRFDQGMALEPFKIRLRIPAQILEMRHGEHSRWPGKAAPKPRYKKPQLVRVSGGAVPAILGGHPLPNMAKTRRYGARTFIE